MKRYTSTLFFLLAIMTSAHTQEDTTRAFGVHISYFRNNVSTSWMYQRSNFILFYKPFTVSPGFSYQWNNDKRWSSTIELSHFGISKQYSRRIGQISGSSPGSQIGERVLVMEMGLRFLKMYRLPLGGSPIAISLGPGFQTNYARLDFDSYSSLEFPVNQNSLLSEIQAAIEGQFSLSKYLKLQFLVPFSLVETQFSYTNQSSPSLLERDENKFKSSITSDFKIQGPRLGILYFFRKGPNEH